MVTEVATDIELIVLRWLDKNRIRYEFQTSLRGGFYQLGGAVVDILISDRMLAWRIFGEYWHKGVEKEGSDILQREILNEMGYTVVDLLEQDLRDRPEETLRLALQGMEMLR